MLSRTDGILTRIAGERKGVHLADSKMQQSWLPGVYFLVFAFAMLVGLGGSKKRAGKNPKDVNDEPK
jgi:hypothetical protein